MSEQKMDAQKVDMFMLFNSKYFESFQLPAIKDKLLQMDDAKWGQIELLQFKEPSITLIISLIGGALGIDRFYLGDIGLGVGKLLTCGGMGIWAIVDWFLIMDATRQKNLETLRQAMY